MDATYNWPDEGRQGYLAPTVGILSDSVRRVAAVYASVDAFRATDEVNHGQSRALWFMSKPKRIDRVNSPPSWPPQAMSHSATPRLYPGICAKCYIDFQGNPEDLLDNDECPHDLCKGCYTLHYSSSPTVCAAPNCHKTMHPLKFSQSIWVDDHHERVGFPGMNNVPSQNLIGGNPAQQNNTRSGQLPSTVLPYQNYATLYPSPCNYTPQNGLHGENQGYYQEHALAPSSSQTSSRGSDPCWTPDVRPWRDFNSNHGSNVPPGPYPNTNFYAYGP